MIGFRIGTALAGVSALFYAGCAGIPASQPQPASVAVTGKEVLFVADPVIADSVDTLLSGLGWGGGRFSRELKKEMIYQFNRKGVAVAEDSSKAKAGLAVSCAQYSRDGSSTHFRFGAILTTPAGERYITVEKVPQRAEAPERDDPTVDNIRMIATSLVEQSGKDPSEAKKKAKAKGADYNPGLLLVF